MKKLIVGFIALIAAAAAIWYVAQPVTETSTPAPESSAVERLTPAEEKTARESGDVTTVVTGSFKKKTANQ